MIRVNESVIEAIQSLCNDNHPNEIILLLRGRREKGDIIVTEYLIPPMGYGTKGSASFPAHMLPMDLTLIGTVHNHPSGNRTPSVGDLHNFYGRIMMITGPPYSLRDFTVYNKKGESIDSEVVPGQ